MLTENSAMEQGNFPRSLPKMTYIVIGLTLSFVINHLFNVTIYPYYTATDKMLSPPIDCTPNGTSK
jgi:hypothetical protein